MAIPPEAFVQDCFKNCIKLIFEGRSEQDIQNCIEYESKRIVIELPKIKMSNQLMEFLTKRIRQASSQAESDRLKITIGNIPTIVQHYSKMEHPVHSLNSHLGKQYGIDLYGVKDADILSDSFKQLSVNNFGRKKFEVLDQVRVKGKKKRIGFIFKKLIKGRYKVVIPREQKMLIVKQGELQKVLKKYKHIEKYINRL